MALDTFNPPVPPSDGTKDKPEFKLKKADFGDGYSQTTRFGMNHIRRVLTLGWDVLDPEQADTIESFIVAHGGDTPFLYTPADELKALRWTCEEYDRTKGTPVKMTATFRQNFNLDG